MAAGPGVEARDLRDRIRTLPTSVAVGQLSEEPNGLQPAPLDAVALSTRHPAPCAGYR